MFYCTVYHQVFLLLIKLFDVLTDCCTNPKNLLIQGVFVGLGLSGVVPTLHFVISEGLIKATTMGQMGWLLLMATLYITGACLYAARIPERFFPGKCDIWVGF